MKKLKLFILVCLLSVLSECSVFSQVYSNTTVIILNPKAAANTTALQKGNSVWMLRDFSSNSFVVVGGKVRALSLGTQHVGTNLIMFLAGSGEEMAEKQSLSVKDLVAPLGDLLAAYAWPIVVLILLVCFRAEIKSFAHKVSERLGTAKNVKVTTSGIEIEDHVEALEAKADSQAILQQDILQLINARKTLVVHSSDPNPGLAEVQKLADEYADVRIADWKARVDRKNELVRLMGLSIVAHRLNRTALSNSDHEGIRAGLAGAIHFEPAQDDLNLLVTVARRAKTKHCLYMVVTALARLVDTGFIKKAEIPECEEILAIAQAQADKPLDKRIRKTRALMQFTLASSSQEMS